jgi:hypothetical protein
MIQVKQVGTKLPIVADAVNLLGDSVHTIKKNTETGLVASKEICQNLIFLCFMNRRKDNITI